MWLRNRTPNLFPVLVFLFLQIVLVRVFSRVSFRMRVFFRVRIFLRVCFSCVYF